MRGHGSLQALLGRTGFQNPKRKRDDEQDWETEATGAAGNPGGLPLRAPTRKAIVHHPTAHAGGITNAGPSFSKPASGDRKPPTSKKPHSQPVWDWVKNKPITRVVANAHAKSRPGPGAQVAGTPSEQSGTPDKRILLECALAGRRHRGPSADAAMCCMHAAENDPARGGAVRLAREATNPVDGNAIQVLWERQAGAGLLGAVDRMDAGQPEGANSHTAQAALAEGPILLGHVPSKVAERLAGLLDAGQVTLEATVTWQPPPRHGAGAEASSSGSGASSTSQPGSDTPVLRLACCPAPGLPSSMRLHVQQRLQAAAAEAATAAAGAGALLRDKFLLMAKDLRTLEAHVFSEAEAAMLHALDGLPPAQLSLLLRLVLRKGPWVALRDVAYAEIPDPEAASLPLVSQGLLQAPGRSDCAALLALLPVPRAAELAQALGVPGVCASWRRADVDGALLRACSCATTAAQRCMRRSTSLDRRPSSGGASSAGPQPANQPPLPAGGSRAAPLHIDLDPEPDLAAEGNQDLHLRPRTPPPPASPPKAPRDPAARPQPPRESPFKAAAVQAEALHELDRTAPEQPCSALIDLTGASDVGSQPEGLCGDPAMSAHVQPLLPVILPDEAPRLPPIARRSGSGGGPDAPCPLQAGLLRELGPCVRVAPGTAALIKRMQRVYFLNEAHDLSRWLATVRGALPYPPYTIRRVRPAFPSRQALLEYEAALAAAAVLDDRLVAGDVPGAEAALAPAWAALAEGALARVEWTADPDPVDSTNHVRRPEISKPPAGEDAMGNSSGGGSAPNACPAGRGPPPARPLPLFLARFCAAWVHAGMCTVGVSLHEKARRYPDAVAALRRLLEGKCCPGRRGEWWLRLSIDLEHCGDEEGALVAAEQAINDPWVRHGDRLSLQRRVLRLGRPPRRWKKPSWAAAVMREPPKVVIQGRPLAKATGLKSRFYALGGQQVSVESLALEHYASAVGGRWCGLHCEGGVWACLVGLLLWDCLFADVPDVFRTPFQTAPLDIETDAFYPARRNQLDARLQAIADGGAGELLAQCWAAHHGMWCRGVNWERYSLDMLQDIARCVGGLGLSVVCRMLAEDFAAWRGGMPDLLLWRPEHGDARLVEVKGPRDRLSDAQRAWMAALSAVGVVCEVLRVQEPK